MTPSMPGAQPLPASAPCRGLRLARLAEALAAAGVMGGLMVACAVPPKAPPPAGDASASSAPPAPTPMASAPAAPPAPVLPATPAQQQQAQKIAMAAVELLQAGTEEPAKLELQRALATDPANKLALNLQRQIAADPYATLGRESFAYTVKPGETLSRIAGRYLNDIYAFYLLARYNDIKVPRLVAGGQVIRIPGKAPPPGAQERAPVATAPAPVAATPLPGVTAPPAAPSPAPVAPPVAIVAPPPPPPPPELSPAEKAMASGQAAERAGDLERALADYRRAADGGAPGADGRAEQVRKQLVSRNVTAARRFAARQDLKSAIAAWDRVLELEPDNGSAQLERQKAVDLKKKLDVL